MRLWVVIWVCYMHTIHWRGAEGLPWPDGVGNSLGLVTISEEINSSHLDAERGGRKSAIDSSNTAEMMMSTTEMTTNINETELTVALLEDSEIDEETVAVLYPDWVRQTRSFDTNTGKWMITVVNLDGSEVVRVVRRDYANNWTVKTRSVDLENDRVTLTIFADDGSSLLLELNRGTETVRETQRASDGTTTIREVDAVTRVETVTKLNPDGSTETEETSERDGFKRRNVTRPDGSGEFRKTNLTTRYSNITNFFQNGTREIVTTHPKFGVKNVTLIFPDGRQVIRGVSPTTGAEILAFLFPNGTSRSEVIDDRIAEDFIDVLDPLWTRKVKELDPETGAITLTIYSSDGTRTRRRVKKPCKNYIFGDCEWVETIKKHTPSHMSTIIQVASDGSKKVLTSHSIFTTVTYYDKDGIPYQQGMAEKLFMQMVKCLPGYSPDHDACKKNVDLFGSDTAEKMTSTRKRTHKIHETKVPVTKFKDTEVDEEIVAFIHPNWVRQTMSYDPKTGAPMITIVSRDESKIVRSARRDLEYEWTLKTRSVDLENDRVTVTYFFHNGSSVILELDRGTQMVKMTQLASDGTTTIRQMEPVNVVGTVDELNQDTRENTQGTLERYGFERENVTRPDGSQVLRRTNLAKGYSNVTTIFPNGTREMVTVHPKFGTRNVTWIFLDGRQEIRGFNPTNGAEVREVSFTNGTSTSEVIDDRIPEDFVDFLDPMWTRKVKEVDSETGAITLAIYSSDGTHTRRRVKEPCKNYLIGDCEWVETIRKINSSTGISAIIQVASDGSKKVLTFEGSLTTFTYYDEHGIPYQRGLANRLCTQLVKCRPGYFSARNSCKKNVDLFGRDTAEKMMPTTETTPEIDETTVTTAESEDRGIDQETIAVLYPNWVNQTRSFDPNTGRTMITIVNRDESEIIRSVRQDSEYDWTVKTRSVDLENDRVTLTYFFRNGSSLILELDRGTQMVKMTQRASDGTTIIRQVDPVTVVRTVTHCRVIQDASGETQGTLERYSFGRENVTRPDGSQVFRRTDLATGFSNETTVFPNGTREMVTTHPKFGLKNVTVIAPDGSQKLSGFNPTNGAEVRELVFTNGTLTSEVIDDRIAEDLIDFLDPLWTRKVKEVDPESGAITLTIYSSDGTRTRRRVKGPCKNYFFGDCEWVELIREINSTTGSRTTIKVAFDGSKKGMRVGHYFWTYIYYDKNGDTREDTVMASLFTEIPKCAPGFSLRRDKCRKNIDLFGV